MATEKDLPNSAIRGYEAKARVPLLGLEPKIDKTREVGRVPLIRFVFSASA